MELFSWPLFMEVMKVSSLLDDSLAFDLLNQKQGFMTTCWLLGIFIALYVQLHEEHTLLWEKSHALAFNRHLIDYMHTLPHCTDSIEMEFIIHTVSAVHYKRHHANEFNILQHNLHHTHAVNSW